MSQALRGKIGRLQFLALGFGTVVGSAWVAILGEWLVAAGPGGTVLGLLAGGLSVALIGLCYAELTTRVPETGGEFIYALRIFGPRAAFAVAWMTLLMLVAIMIFEGIALAWFVSRLLPSMGQMSLYRIFGEAVTWQGAAIGVFGAIAVAWLNWRGGTFSARVHSVLTLIFLVGALSLMAAFFAFGSFSNLQPAWERVADDRWWRGALWIFALSAILLNGFQAIPQAVEERSSSVSLRTVAGTIVASILCAALFYVLILLSAASMMPWHELAQADLAVVAAAARLPGGGVWVDVVLIIAIVSLFKTWNGVTFMAARLTLAAARHGLLPAPLARLHARHGSPMVAVLVLALINILGLSLGRGAIVPLLNAASMGMTAILVAVTFGLLRARQQGEPAAYQVPGGQWTIRAALVLGSAMAVVAFVDPWFAAKGSLPLEWQLLIGWLALGALVWVRMAQPRVASLPV
ncbi:APC family permease [Steroidobacter sp.]|uniref:APC family permease n=1 Tax=Steroidobacter sp. TaxID=1978227 RepID=UPI001A604D9D|nr:APC family permease [Steroidobacter sp.]MBL8271074.1 APC family permease [Steroidobacter sp.]